MRFFLILSLLFVFLYVYPQADNPAFPAGEISVEKPEPSAPIKTTTAVKKQKGEKYSENDRWASRNVRSFPPLYYEIQIAYLNLDTEVELFYDNDVQKYIDLFLFERPSQFRQMRNLSSAYFPFFEQQLKNFHLPVELKYLPALESGLSPYACSPSLAKGLWQFKKETGLHYGLVIDEIYDEREDPEKSTIAACKYLRDLYDDFGSWELALLAYNAGPTAVSDAIRKAGNNKDYPEIYPFLTDPARGYLPALIAIMYLMINYEEHFPPLIILKAQNLYQQSG